MEADQNLKETHKAKKKMKIAEYLKIGDAADFLGVSTNTLRNWQQKGIIKVYLNPKNRYRLYKKEDLEALLNSIELVE